MMGSSVTVDGCSDLRIVTGYVRKKYVEKVHLWMKRQPRTTAYDFSAKAWMTSGIYESWLRKLYSQFCRQQRSVLLIVDNCPAHPVVDGLTNVKVAFLPPNATSKLQPMDQGVIRALKVRYRKKLLTRLIASVDSQDEFKVSLLDAMYFISWAWNDMSSSIIKNCFSKSGFSTPESDPAEDDSDSLIAEVGQQLHCLQQSGLVGVLAPEDYIDADEAVETTGDLSNAEIVAQVEREKGKDDEDDNGDDKDNDEGATIVPVSLVEAQASVMKLKCYLQSQDNTSAYFTHLDAIESFLDKQTTFRKQSKITDYMHVFH